MGIKEFEALDLWMRNKHSTNVHLELWIEFELQQVQHKAP